MSVKEMLNEMFFFLRRGRWWRYGHLRRHRHVSRVLELEGELKKKLLRLAIPIRPELAFAFVHFATRKLERDRLVWLAGEEKILKRRNI